MASRNPFDDVVLRLRTLLVVMLCGFGLLAGGMWFKQVAHGDRYQQSLQKQSVRRVRLPGRRGRIYDSRGLCLADNRPSYCIAVYLEELRQSGGWTRTIDRVELMLDRLALVLGIPREISREDIATHVRKRLPLPLLAWRDVSPEVLARFSERAGHAPGVDVYVQAVRTYPIGKRACHIIGYVGRADPAGFEDNPYHYYLPEMAGRRGIEAKLDEALRGEAGGRLVRVDVSGFRHEDLGGRAPRAGSDVLLAIDMNAQRIAEEALGDDPGAVVILDPRNGDVLAMASTPGFNPNDFVPSISTARWAAMRDDKDTPLRNRAVVGGYAPGSIFKPVVAMAALENDQSTAATSYKCDGVLNVGNTSFRCWTRGRHGVLAMREALMRSCNVYFYRLGMNMGHEYIAHMARAVGLGRKTGINLPYEISGLVPDGAWVRAERDHRWRVGDTCNLSIGQGALTVTPLQMALVTSAIANGGHLYRPRLIKGVRQPGQSEFRELPIKVANELNWSPRSIQVVREGMRDVIMAKRGTGKLARVEGLTAAGKTGTAEYGRKSEGRKRGWMIAFAPYDEPRYVVAVLIENAAASTAGSTP